MQIKYFLGKTKIVQKERLEMEKNFNKLEKFLGMDGQNALCEVEIARDKKGFWRMEVNLKTPRASFRAEESGLVLLDLSDVVENSLKRQIKKNKDKKADLRREQSINGKKALLKGENF